MEEYTKGHERVKPNREKSNKKVSISKVTKETAKIRAATEAIQIRNSEELRDMVENGLGNLVRELGISVMLQIMDQEVTELCGEKGRHNKDRKGYRHGYDDTSVVLDGTKLRTMSPRVRAVDGSGEIPLETLTIFQQADQLNQSIFARLINGVSCRKYAKTVNNGDYEQYGTSASSVSRRYREELKVVMERFFARQLDEEYFSIMVDGISVNKMMVLVALGITTDGKKQILGLNIGSTENAMAVNALFRDIIERGVDPTVPRLYVIDGSKALHKAITDTFGDDAAIQRCQFHKMMNVLDKLPESQKGWVGQAMRMAYLEYDYDSAASRLKQLSRQLDPQYPDAAASLLEGLEETLTVNKLNVPARLRKTLKTTNCIESSNSTARHISRRNKKYSGNGMILKHMAAAYMVAEESFRRITGYKEIPFLTNLLCTLSNIKIEHEQQPSA